MVKILKPILLVFIKSKAMKRLIVDLLKALAKQTDNTIDDQAVSFIESRLYPGSTTNLQKPKENMCFCSSTQHHGPCPDQQQSWNSQIA